MSKKSQQEEGRCPMCRLPIFLDGSRERTVKIDLKFMTFMLNEVGGCGEKFLNHETKRFEAPALPKGQSYATYPDTAASVSMWCKSKGPHACVKIGCSSPFCNNSVTPKGCQCYLLTWKQKQTCWDAKRSAEREQQASGAKKRRKVCDDELEPVTVVDMVDSD